MITEVNIIIALTTQDPAITEENVIITAVLNIIQDPTITKVNITATPLGIIQDPGITEENIIKIPALSIIQNPTKIETVAYAKIKGHKNVNAVAVVFALIKIQKILYAVQSVLKTIIFNVCAFL
jgi:hypothetical protein